MQFVQKPACDPISCPRPAPGVHNPVWVDSALPSATRQASNRCSGSRLGRLLFARTRLENTTGVFAGILRYSPSLLQVFSNHAQVFAATGWRIPPGILRYSPVFSKYSPTTSGWYSPSILPGASSRRRLPQRRLLRQNGAARRRRAPRTADRCKSALINSDQLSSAVFGPMQGSAARRRRKLQGIS